MRYRSHQSALRTTILVLISGFCTIGYAEEEFTYHPSDSSPLKWGSISKTCSAGKEQSPINLPRVDKGQNLVKLKFNYKPNPIKVINNGHTIKFEYEAGGSMQWRGQRYYLKQFHFHTRSEHTIDGKHFPIEMHLVHEDEDGNTAAVVGVMIRAGDKRNNALPRSRRLRHILPSERGGKYMSEDMIDIKALLPKDRSSYRYWGSLTTPGCDEEIHWLVFATPIEISSKQMNELRQALINLEFARNDGTNNRPIQQRNGRAVYFDRKTD